MRCQSQSVCRAAFKGEAEKWNWIKIGPVNALAIYPAVYVNIDGDANTTVWIDKAVLSTNPALTTEQLEKAE